MPKFYGPESIRLWRDANFAASAGMLKNPFVRTAIRMMPGLDGEDVDKLANRLERHVRPGNVGDVAEFIGNIGPDLAAGGGMFAGGKFLVTQGMKHAAPRILARAAPARMAGFATPEGAAAAMLKADAGAFGAARGGVGMGAGAIGNPLTTMPREFVAGQAAKLIARSKDFAGATRAIGKPGIERLGEVVGGSLGFGSFMAGREALESEQMDPGRMGSAFIHGALITAAFEGAIIGAGKLLTNKASPINLERAVNRFMGGAGKTRQDAVGNKLNTDLEKAGDVLAKRRISLEYQRQVIDQMDELESAGFVEFGDDAWGGAKRILKRRERGFDAAERVFDQRVGTLDAFDQTFVSQKLGQYSITGDGTPYNPQEGWLSVQDKLMKTFKTIDDYAGRLGIAGTKTVRNLMHSEVESLQAKAANDSFMMWNMGRMAEVMKVSRKDKRIGSFADPVFALAETKGKGISAVREVYGEEVAGLVSQTQKLMKKRYTVLERMGAARMIDPAEFGVDSYLPHVFKHMDEKAFQAQMRKGLGRVVFKDNQALAKAGRPHLSPADQIVEVDNLLLSAMNYRKAGFAKFGSIDNNRMAHGTLEKLVEAGVPFESNPYTAMSRYLDQVERRIAFGKRFGLNNELIDPMKQIVAAEGGSEALFSNITDTFFGKNYADEHFRRMMQNVSNYQILAKLPFAPIANSTQPFTTTIPFMGIGNTFKGFQSLMRARGSEIGKQNIHNLDVRVGIMDGIFQSLRKSAMGGSENLNWSDRFVDKMFKINGFTTGERFNRMLSGATVMHHVEEQIAKGLTGRLRGTNLDAARRKFQKLDLDYDDVIRRYKNGGKLAEHEIDKAVYLGTEFTQFMPSLRRRPLLWNHPAGRVLTQFNTFVFGQYNFLRNHVLTEAAAGNLGPAANVFAIYPIAGEFVGTAHDIVKGRRRNRPRGGLARAIDNSSMVGGMGIATNLYQAARYNRVAEQFIGPTGSDVATTAESLAHLITSGNIDPLMRFAAKQPAVQAGFAITRGAGLAADELVKLWEPEAPNFNNPKTLDDMIQRSKAQGVQ